MDLFLLKKIIASFILFPGLPVLFLLVSGVILVRQRRGRVATFNIAVGALIWAASIQPVANLAVAGIERGQSIPSVIQGDVIILLGGGSYENARDLTGVAVPTEDMMCRIVTAVRIQKRLDVPIVVSGGTAAGRLAEAPIIRRFLVDLGVPSEKVLLEDKSRDTTENARYCRAICIRHGFRSPLLVTSGYHMRRSVDAFRRQGMKVTPLPAFLRSGSAPRSHQVTDFLPDVGALATTSTALREWIGLMFYKLGGS